MLELYRLINTKFWITNEKMFTKFWITNEIMFIKKNHF